MIFERPMKNLPKSLLPGIFFFLFLLGLSYSSNAYLKTIKLGLSPSAIDDSTLTCSGVAIQIPILNNDFTNAPGASIDSTTVDLGPGHGKSIHVAGGDFKVDPITGLVTFTPILGFSGIAITQYRFYDNQGNLSNLATIKVTVVKAPNSYLLQGGGNYCQGTFAGVGVGLANSDLGVNYTLVINGTITGLTLPGSGGPVYFGNQTIPGTYRILATDQITGCNAYMASSVTVTSVNPPNTYNVLGGGIGCSSGAGVSISLDGSDIGVNYQLQNGAILVGSPVPGTGGPISFLPVNGSSGNYIVTAISSSTSCSTIMNGSAIVTIYSNPLAYNLTGSGLCEGNSGNDIKLSSSQIGVNYQLLQNGNAIGNPIAGTGSAIHFTGFTLPGLYTAIAIDPSSCSTTMNGSVQVNPAPNRYTFGTNPIVHYCTGTSGTSITLQNSDINVNYQLLNNGSIQGNLVPGTGSSLVFGPLTSGNYSVVATNSITGCVSNPSDTIQVIADNTPTNNILYTNPGNGHYCEGSPGVDLLLNGSETGVNYQLIRNGNPSGSPIPGTGNPLDFGNQLFGNYFVIQSFASGGSICNSINSDTVSVVLDSLPAIYPFVSDTVHFCTNNTGGILGLIGSKTGIVYQLINNNSFTTVSTVAGTGGPINFGNQKAGSYTVFATNINTGCINYFPTNGTIIADSIPKSFIINPPNPFYCSGQAGVNLSLSNSEVGVQYQLYSGTNPIGNILLGTGNALNLGIQTSGNYYVMGTRKSNGCAIVASDTVLIQKDSLPQIFNLGPVSPHYCINDSGVHLILSGSETGVNYQLIEGANPIGPIIPGSGNPIDFGLRKAGVYFVNETNALTLCTNSTLQDSILVDSLPKVYSLTPHNPHYCSTSGVDLQLSGSQVGITYQLINNGVNLGSPIPGTGAKLDFGTLSSGNYWVLGYRNPGSCQKIVSDTSLIIKDSSLLNFNLSGKNEYCPQDNGTTLILSGSESGVSYQLLSSGNPIGNPVLGTGSSLLFTNIRQGTYIVQGTGIGGCNAIMNGGNPYIIKAPLQVKLSLQNSNCNSSNTAHIGLNIKGGTLPYKILWNNGKTDTSLSNLGPGTYSATITDSIGCSVNVSTTISPSVPPVVGNISKTTLFSTPINFTGLTDTSLNYASLDFDPISPGIQDSLILTGKGKIITDQKGNITFIPFDYFVGTATINYTVMNHGGCTSNIGIISIMVEPNKDPNQYLTIPTLFTPNGDGVNDNFIIVGIDNYPDNTLEIYNRWGNIVYSAKGYSTTNAWTGNGLGDGTYYYLLKVAINGQNKVYNGYIVIIRPGK